MKRRHLFELEDQAWFPAALRVAVTRYIVAFHRLLGTADEIAALAARALEESGARQIHDLGSGQGGPQADVLAALRRLLVQALHAGRAERGEQEWTERERERG